MCSSDLGLSRVFTGFSWAGPDTSVGRFYGAAIPAADPDREVRPMQAYPQYHSTSEKRFLGSVIAAGSADGNVDLATALDRLTGHPNVGPFLGRQLIQRLVTSNPSPAYVGRVAAAFAAGTYTSGTWTISGTDAAGNAVTVSATVANPIDAQVKALQDAVLQLSSTLTGLTATMVNQLKYVRFKIASIATTLAKLKKKLGVK